MEPSAEELRKTFTAMSDDRLIKLATREAVGLRPEAVQIIEEEIIRRGISVGVTAGMHAQRKEYTVEELNSFCGILRVLPCPDCGSAHMKLNAVLTGHCTSFLIMTHYERRLRIGCSECLLKALNNATIRSSLLGWWGFPWGIVRTIGALRLNHRMGKEAELPEATGTMLAFVHQHVGVIEANKDDTERLRQLIKDQS